MKSMSLEETKKVELDILVSVADFCDRNGFKYFLAYGTLIGAIRHKGFIPWDDDIDLWMPRDDYNKFIEIFNEQCENRDLMVIDPETDIARHSFAKVINTKTLKIEKGVDYRNGHLGVDVDIFPLDGTPEIESDFKAWYKVLQKYYRAFLMRICVPPKKIKSIVKRLLYLLIYGSKKNILKKTKLLHSRYPYSSCTFIGSIDSCFNSMKERFEKNLFEEAVLVDFEGLQFKAPKGYDTILTKLYGDYMTPPPEEKRVTHHSNNTFWKEEM